MLNIPEYENVKSVFQFFEEIAKIPHGSGETEKIADYLVSFANERGLSVKRDGANNVIIRKNATRGYADRPTVILQGHTDMVLARTADCIKDLSLEGLDLYIDGDYLRARGTTLGGDDGVAVAYALALLDSDDIPHPAIEAIFTSDEEIGLLGAVALDCSDIEGRVMLNIDSDAEGIFTVGCAGGMRIDVKFPTRVTKTQEKGAKLRVYGLKGGHSGVEINKGRANAIKILAEIIKELGASIAYISGGNADNAIPRDAECIIETTLSAERISEACGAVCEKYRAIEPDIAYTYEVCDGSFAFIENSSELISLINSEPSGVIAMSEDIPGLVETSLNLGIIESGECAVTLSFSLRSAKGTEKGKLATRVTKIATEHGATCASHGEYPAWEYRKESHLRDVMCTVYEKMYGESAKVVTIHAGLECGIFSDKLEGLDCVSIGPDNHDIHTTEERLSIPSTARVWEFVKEVLKNI